MKEGPKLKKSYISSRSFEDIVDLYWLSYVYLGNIKEDVEGADDRLPYLMGLRIKLLSTLYEMDLKVCGDHSLHDSSFIVPDALQRGIKSLDIAGEDLLEMLMFNESRPPYNKLKVTMINLCNAMQNIVPNGSQDVQNQNGMSFLMKAIRNWSNVGAEYDESISFLSKRLTEL